jgi:hypothetical protein
MTSGEQARPIGYHEPVEGAWDDPSPAPLIPVQEQQSVLTRLSRRRTVLRRIAGAALVLAVFAKVLWPVAGTLGTTDIGPWDVRITSGGRGSVVVLAYGREAGVHLMRVPAASQTSEVSARLSAQIGESPLYLISLGRTPLEVSAIAPKADASWKARGRIIQAFKDARGTGVRTW